jgi:hypothetical protein
MKSLFTLLCGIVLFSCAHGQQVTATFSTVNPYLAIQGTHDGGATTLTYASGVMVFSGFSAFCDDVSQSIEYNDTVHYQVVSASSVSHSDLYARIISLYLASDRSALEASAAQWAIWETLTDGEINPSFSTGLTRITDSSASNVIAKAMTYLSRAPSQSAANVTFLSSPTKQDMIAFNLNFNAIVIPEPHVSIAAVLGLLPMLRRRRASGRA